MNISANLHPLHANITPLNNGEARLPKENSLTTIEPTATPVSNVSTTPNAVKSVANPTYEKPITQANGDEATSVPNSPDKKIDSNANQDDTSEADNGTETNPSQYEPQKNNEVYNEAELKQISALKQRDAEVNAHERAHAAVGGQHAGSPSYSYKTGPDGVKYAVSGEVSIDTSRIPGDPQATLQKAQQIKAAALAPAEPSGQDRKVAAKADQMATQARSEMLEMNNSGENKSSASSSQIEASVPDHFTGEQQLSIDGKQASIEQQMHERNLHIHALYENTSRVSALPHFEIQA